MFEGMESAFQSPVSPSADPDREATHRQVPVKGSFEKGSRKDYYKG